MFLILPPPRLKSSTLFQDEELTTHFEEANPQPLKTLIHHTLTERLHQNKEAVRHAYETGRRSIDLKKPGRSRRTWLRTSVVSDSTCYHINPSRSSEAAKKLFTDTAVPVNVVCDRCSAYKKTARESAGKVTLCFRRANVGRDFIDYAAGHPHL